VRKINWGVLSTAKIGVQKVIPAMQGGLHCSVSAIASRDLTRASAAAAALGLPKAYGSYEALLADPDIDAIYNPLPNHLHVPWTIKALEAGKHVLCEKPIGLTAHEAEALVEARDRSGKHVLEAFMVRQHPQWQQARVLAQSGRIGELRAVQTTFSYFNPDPANIRNQADIGGGALYDIGCYAVLTARFMFGTEPNRAVALVDRDPDMKIDRITSGLVDFPAGRQLVFLCATQMARYQKVHMFGTKGRIEIEIPFNAPPGRPGRILVEDENTSDKAGCEIIETEHCDQYTLQGDEASRVFLNEIPAPYPIEDAIQNMRVLDALYRSAESCSWESI
jgi:predicted dehydrogenase